MKKIRETLKEIEDIEKLGKADLHIHSNYSDGRPTIEEVLDYVETKTDLDVIAICDHNTIKGALFAQELMAAKRHRFDLIIGEEITTKEGHILGLFLDRTIPSGLPAHDALLEIKRQGGIAVASHPFQRTTIRNPDEPMMDGVGMLTLVKEVKLFDGVETVNATPTLSEENIKAGFLNNALLFKAETGSSDAHIVEAIGRGYTLFEGKSAADLRNAIEKRQTQAVHAGWGFRALMKYLFFFIPKGLRMLSYTLLHGRSKKPPLH